jgi:O-antigen/teichoic acid export membrane protein
MSLRQQQLPERQQFYFQDNTPSSELGRSALRGGVVSIVSRVVNVITQVVYAVVMARLLTPEDFGLVAMLTALTGFAPMLIDFGLGDATAQKSRLTHGEVSSLFWIGFGMGLLIAVSLAVASPAIAWLYREPRLRSITVISAITFLLLGMSGQHLALLRRTMQFGVIAKIEIISNLAAMLVPMALAYLGFGYWALVVRPIVSGACLMAGAWSWCRWKPGVPVIDQEVKSMVRFGMNIVGFTTSNFVGRASDRVALGLCYQPSDVGYYQNALAMYENTLLALLASVHNVGSVALSKLQSDRVRLKQKYLSAMSSLAFFAMPASAVLAVIAEDLLVLLLGEKWRVAGGLLSIMALRGILHVVGTSQGWLHLSIGRADRWMRWGGVASIVQLLAILAGLSFGVRGVAISFAVAGSLLAFPSISYAGRPAGIGAVDVMLTVWRQLLGALVIVASGWPLRDAVFAGFCLSYRIALSLVSGISIYLLVVVGLFRLSEPLKLAARLSSEYAPASLRSWFMHHVKP